MPEFVKGEFSAFYPLLFDRQRREAGEDAVFLEYAWAVAPNRPTCDPCTAPYLAPEELRGLGAYWVTPESRWQPNVFLTRLHLRYDRRHFPEDLVLQETGDHVNWQARYVIHHSYAGPDDCPAKKPYLETVWARRKQEAANYASLTGADADSVRQRMGLLDDGSRGEEAASWWERLWKR